MKVTLTKLPGVKLIEPDIHCDDRGIFFESYQLERYQQALGIQDIFVQDNVSQSYVGVLRGLHFQSEHAQGKLVHVVVGEVYDVVVDVRQGSPTFGQFVSVAISQANRKQLWIPRGFAHGFYSMTDMAIVSYKVTDRYHAASEHTLLWNDPDLGIDWPLVGPPKLSSNDKRGVCLADFPGSILPRYEEVSL